MSSAKTNTDHSSRYRSAKKILQKKILTIRTTKDILLLTAGIFSAGFALESFLLPNDFIDGGAKAFHF
jgi:uncharacterized membrane-anchored protein YitT (DUF2179 family)